MAQEVFQAVREAEEQADQRIQEAQKQARELLKAAETAVTEEERKGSLEHRTLYQQIMDDKRQRLVKQLETQRPNVQQAQAESLVPARAKLDQAAHRIVERVLNDGHC